MTHLPNLGGHTRHMTIAVRSGVFRIDPDLRETIEKRVRRGLRRYARRISEIRVWLDDANGPRGGVDRTCRIQVDLSSAGTSTVESRSAAPLESRRSRLRLAYSGHDDKELPGVPM